MKVGPTFICSSEAAYNLYIPHFLMLHSSLSMESSPWATPSWFSLITPSFLRDPHLSPRGWLCHMQNGVTSAHRRC